MMNTLISNRNTAGKTLLDALDRNEPIPVLYRGKKRARLVPLLPQEKRLKAAEHPAFGMWKGRISDKDVPKIVRQMRKGRFDAL